MPQQTHDEFVIVRDSIQDILQETMATCSLFDAIESTLDTVDVGTKRPAFSLLPSWACQAVGGNPYHAVPASAAWHLLYVAALLLDDVEDGELSRKSWPPMTAAQAVNIATALTFASQLALLRFARFGVEPLRARSVQETFSSTGLQVCAGQHWDLERTSLSLDECWQMISAKSGASFSLACRTGAILGTNDRPSIERYAEFGHNLGILVQIVDDLQGTWHTLGPGDLVAGCRTLPVVYALSVGSPRDRAHLFKLLDRASDDPSAAVEARRVLTDLGALEYLLAEATIYRSRARDALLPTEENTESSRLIGLLNQTAAILD